MESLQRTLFFAKVAKSTGVRRKTAVDSKKRNQGELKKSNGQKNASSPKPSRSHSRVYPSTLSWLWSQDVEWLRQRTHYQNLRRSGATNFESQVLSQPQLRKISSSLSTWRWRKMGLTSPRIWSRPNRLLWHPEIPRASECAPNSCRLKRTRSYHSPKERK